jgi:hypothetical protein
MACRGGHKPLRHFYFQDSGSEHIFDQWLDAQQASSTRHDASISAPENARPPGKTTGSRNLHKKEL